MILQGIYSANTGKQSVFLYLPQVELIGKCLFKGVLEIFPIGFGIFPMGNAANPTAEGANPIGNGVFPIGNAANPIGYAPSPIG